MLELTLIAPAAPEFCESRARLDSVPVLARVAVAPSPAARMLEETVIVPAAPSVKDVSVRVVVPLVVTAAAVTPRSALWMKVANPESVMSLVFV